MWFLVMAAPLDFCRRLGIVESDRSTPPTHIDFAAQWRELQQKMPRASTPISSESSVRNRLGKMALM